jgi:hypothetical protein
VEHLHERRRSRFAVGAPKSEQNVRSDYLPAFLDLRQEVAAEAGANGLTEEPRAEVLNGDDGVTGGRPRHERLDQRIASHDLNAGPSLLSRPLGTSQLLASKETLQELMTALSAPKVRPL